MRRQVFIVYLVAVSGALSDSFFLFFLSPLAPFPLSAQVIKVFSSIARPVLLSLREFLFFSHSMSRSRSRSLTFSISLPFIVVLSPAFPPLESVEPEEDLALSSSLHGVYPLLITKAGDNMFQDMAAGAFIRWFTCWSFSRGTTLFVFFFFFLDYFLLFFIFIINFISFIFLYYLIVFPLSRCQNIFSHRCSY